MISCIVAVAENNAIGKNNKLLWHIKEDLNYFKEVTMHNKIIMGRKTFESLPRILPGRHHIVITNNKQFYVNEENVEIEHNIFNVLERYKDSSEEVFIIGGGLIFQQTLPVCSKLYITKIHKSFEADVFFPTLDFNNYSLIKKSNMHTDIKSSLNFTFEIYKKK